MKRKGNNIQQQQIVQQVPQPDFLGGVGGVVHGASPSYTVPGYDPEPSVLTRRCVLGPSPGSENEPKPGMYSN